MRKLTIALMALSVYWVCWPAHGASDSSAFPVEFYGLPGSCTVATVEYNWHDNTRNRDVPVRIYYPKNDPQPSPVIVFSHGLGGSREGYEYLGRHWASHGYVSVHPTHLGSDSSVLRQSFRPYEALRKAAADIQNALNRPKDISFAIDQLAVLGKTNELFKGRLDLDKIGVAGHSFGAFTVLAAAGETFVGADGRARSLGDPRIRAAIAMSAPAKPQDGARLNQAYGTIAIPCFHMTGTEDASPIGDTRPEDRRIPFDHMTAADNYLMTLKGGDHSVFARQPRGWWSGRTGQRFHDLILAGSTAFWDAYLKSDAAAREWLADGGLQKTLGSDGVFEKRIAPSKSD